MAEEYYKTFGEQAKALANIFCTIEELVKDYNSKSLDKIKIVIKPQDENNNSVWIFK